MRISEIVRGKGAFVATVRPDATVRELLAELAEHNIGAAIVSPDGTSIAGIASERDVARGLHTHGARLLDMPVSQVMTADVRTCKPSDQAGDLRVTMIDYRIRHLPVVDDDGALAGIVSIGDVVKSAISELETEREHLVDYIGS